MSRIFWKRGRQDRLNKVKPQSKTARPSIDSLEQRQLMAYSPFGFSRPDLVVEGFAAPAASYGRDLSVVMDVRNFGASSIKEPLAFFDSRATNDPAVPRYMSTADAPTSTARVYVSASPEYNENNVFPIGDVAIPEVRQNTLVRTLPDDGLPPNIVIPNSVPATINTAPAVTLPARADLSNAFPRTAGLVYLYFEIDPDDRIAEHDETNNLNRRGIPVRVVPPEGEFEAVGLDVARGLTPGDLITPNIKIANYGTIDVTPAPLEAELVQSANDRVDAKDVRFAQFRVPSVNPITLAPTKRLTKGLKNLDDPANVTTVLASAASPAVPAGPNVRIPNSLNGYRFGLAVDPNNRVNELTEPKPGPANRISQFRRVSAPLRGIGPVNKILNASARPLQFQRRTLPS